MKDNFIIGLVALVTCPLWIPCWVLWETVKVIVELGEAIRKGEL